MATNVTRGLELLLYIGDQVIGGQRDASISMEAESIDISNKNDYGWSSTIGGSKSWSVSTNSLFITDDAGQKALMEAFIAGENVEVELKNESESVYFAGTCQITSVEVSMEYSDVCQMDIELAGIGELKLTKEA
jgi:TP901-1 family phage major tail protein